MEQDHEATDMVVAQQHLFYYHVVEGMGTYENVHLVHLNVAI